MDDCAHGWSPIRAATRASTPKGLSTVLRELCCIICFFAAFFAVDRCDDLLHRWVGNGHIQNVATLHNSSDDRLERSARGIDLELQSMALRLQDLDSIDCLDFFVDGARQLNAEALLPTAALCFQERSRRLLQQQIDRFCLQVVTL